LERRHGVDLGGHGDTMLLPQTAFLKLTKKREKYVKSISLKMHQNTRLQKKIIITPHRMPSINAFY